MRNASTKNGGVFVSPLPNNALRRSAQEIFRVRHILFALAALRRRSDKHLAMQKE